MFIISASFHQDLHMEVACIYWLTLKVESFIHGLVSINVDL